MKINPESASTNLSRWQKFQPICAALLLVMVCALPRWSPIELAGGELFWKVAYAWFLGSSLIVLWPQSSRWLAARWGIFAPQRAPDAWSWFDAIAFTYSVVPLLQYTIPFSRPPGTSLPDLGGFPSGHMVSSFAISWLVWRTLPKLSALWFALAVFIGWARIATHDHYAYQVLSGAAVGIVFGWASAQLREGVFLPRLWLWARRIWTKSQSN